MMVPSLRQVGVVEETSWFRERSSGARGRGLVAGIFMVGLALAATSVDLEAQDERSRRAIFVVEARGGTTVPLGAEALAAVTERGPSVGGSLSVRLTPHVAVTGIGGYHMLEANEEDAGAPVPDMNVLSVLGGVEYHFVEAENPWNAVLSLGAGVAKLETEEMLDDGSPATLRLDATALAFRGGLKLAYEATSFLNVFFEPGGHLMILDEELTGPYAVVAPGVENAFSTMWLLPLQAGVRLRL